MWLTVDKDGTESSWHNPPERRYDSEWHCKGCTNLDFIDNLDIGTIFKLTGKQITWEDEPILYEGT